MLGRTAEPNTRIGPIKTLLRNSAPPASEVIHIEANHEIARKLVVVESLQNELGAAVPEPGITIVLPHLLEPQVYEKAAAGLIVLAARYEWEQ
jgi:hypothetical protein